MDELTKIEEILLISIWQLKADAYGYRIRKHISKVIQKEFTFGNLYSALNQLVRKGYVKKSIGEPAENRRGKNKIYYNVTPEGLKALKSAIDMHEQLWDSVSKDLMFKEI